MWELVRAAGTLDLNSCYVYLMLARWHAATSIVAEAADDENGPLAGLITAYRLPEQPDHLFVWQVGVAPEYRGIGLAGRMLDSLVRRLDPAPLMVETTISPSNTASQSLFRSFARRFSASVTEEMCFPEDLFPGAGHEAELLFRIGPLKFG
ncbi:diaminobutyrate acetyltransferase [Telmatospirillum sp. J64-1]|uniref:diaminobutyrate acetyltransferase n=1 Tax=Telmatospirillum sp. J64-1 TaxID=2502183 RepID=UPI00115EC3C7